jgi:hypothetical protein
LRSKENGWPMPPPAPSTATFVCRAGLVEKARVCADRRRAAERVNMKKRRKVMIVSWRCERKQVETVNADVSEFNYSIAGPRAELPDHALMPTHIAAGAGPSTGQGTFSFKSFTSFTPLNQDI